MIPDGFYRCQTKRSIDLFTFDSIRLYIIRLTNGPDIITWNFVLSIGYIRVYKWTTEVIPSTLLVLAQTCRISFQNDWDTHSNHELFENCWRSYVKQDHWPDAYLFRLFRVRTLNETGINRSSSVIASNEGLGKRFLNMIITFQVML